MDLFMSTKERLKQHDLILMDKLENTLPSLMIETGIDMWIVSGDEYNETPVLKTLLPSTYFHARGKTILVFVLKEGHVKRYTVSKPEFNIEAFYEPILLKPPHFDFETFYSTFGTQYDLDYIRQLPVEDVYPRIARLIEETNPTEIAIGFSKLTPFADGLTYTGFKAMLSAISPQYYSRVISSETLCIRWLETRTDLEEKHMKKVVEQTRAIVKAGYSRKNVTPGVTTIGDLRYYFMDEAEKRGMIPWFNSTVWIKRKGYPHLEKDDEIIQENDLLHCDFGVKHLNLCSDIQEIAFVKGDQRLLEDYTVIHKKCKMLQDIVMRNLKAGRTGNAILKASLAEAIQAGIQRPMIYTHPIGNYGHGPGPTIGRFTNQDYVDGMGDVALSNNTCFALELNIREDVPSLDNMTVLYGLEGVIIFKDDEATFIAGRQENIHII